MVAALGPELLTNGDLVDSVGVGAASVAGPGWTSSYVPAANLFAAGAGTFAFFTTNAGQVTANNPAATPFAALGGRSMAVNVGPNTAIPIIQWTNIELINGQTYRFSAMAGIIFAPYSVALRIDGALITPLAVPPAAGVWTPTDTNFVWTGTTGPHTVGIHSNSGAAAGNDHVFDDFSLRAVVDASWGTCCGTPFAEGCLSNGNRWLMVGNEDGTVTIWDTDTGLVANPNDIVDCPTSPAITTFQDHQLFTPWSTQAAIVGTTGANGGNLIAWQVECLALPVTIQVNGVQAAMAVGEVIASRAQDDRVLADEVTVFISGAGHAHLTSERRSS